MQFNNPEWKYCFYDDADVQNYVLLNYGAVFRDYLQAINPKYGAARADLFRYLLIYKEGGVYLDIKSRISRPLNEVIRPDDRFLISQWGNGLDRVHRELHGIKGGEYQQWFIASAPGHPYLKAVIEVVIRNIAAYTPLRHSIGKAAVLRVTGPIAYTRAIAPIQRDSLHRFVRSDVDLGFDYSIYAEQEHQAALGRHYSEVSEALVHRNVGTTAAVALRRMIKKVRGRLS